METPVKRPDLVDMVIFRENTEDIYAGIEFREGTPEVEEFKKLFAASFPKLFKKIRFPGTFGHWHQADLARGHANAWFARRSSTPSPTSARASRSCTRATS